MTVTASDRRREYAGNGVANAFLGPRIFAADELAVYEVDDATGAEVELTSPADYTVAGLGLASSTVTLVSPTPTGTTLVLLRTVAFTQPLRFTNQGAFFPELHEEGFDRAAMRDQQLKDQLDRTLRISDTAVLPSGFSAVLPGPSPLRPVVWNAAGTGLQNGDTELTGDMLLRGNLAGNGGAALVSYVAAAVGSVLRTLESKQRERLSVLDVIPPEYHAGIQARTATADVAGYINAALVFASAQGKDCYAPGGLYPCAAGIVIDESADTDDYSPRAALIGDGPSNTVFDFANGAMTGCTIQGGSGSGSHMNIRSGGFGLRKADRLGVGLLVDNCAYAKVSDVLATGWQYGLKGTDVLTATFDRLTLRNNDYGFELSYINGSYPNALLFNCCEIGINKYAAGNIFGGGSLTMLGGAVEGNGWGGTGADNWGIYIENAGAESGVGLNIVGTYFEANEGVADVWIKTTTAVSAQHSLTGATFNRINSTDYTTNNIRVENTSTGTVGVSVGGCGFKRFGSYAANAGRQYINRINTGGGLVRINRVAGNYYADSAENAELSGISDSESSLPIMWGRFSVGAGVVNLVATKNVALTTYNGVGDYTITLQEGVTGASYGVFPGNNHSTFCAMQAFKATDTTITVKAFDAAGVAMNPAGFSLQVYALR